MTDLFLRPLFTWRSAVIGPGSTLAPTTRHVLLTLGIHMNEAGESCWPSTRLLAAETGLSERAVCTHIEIAVKTGWISKKQSAAHSGKAWKRTVYVPVIPQKALNDVQHLQGTEPRSAPSRKAPIKSAHSRKALKDVQHLQGTERHAEGTERRDIPLTKSTSKSTSVGRASRLAPDFVLPEEWIVWALEAQPTWDRVHVGKTGANFKDYWTAKPKDATKLDWLATWRTWVRKEPALRVPTPPAAEEFSRAKPDPRCAGKPDGVNRCCYGAVFYPGSRGIGYCRHCDPNE